MLLQAVRSISDLINVAGMVNLDFADVSSVMKDAGRAHMGVGRAAGKNKAEEAARMAVSSPLLETAISGATGVLINVTGSMDIGLEEVETAANLVGEAAQTENIIFGATFDESLEDEIRVTVIATGFDENQTASFSSQQGAEPAAPPEQEQPPAAEEIPAPPPEPIPAPVPTAPKPAISDDEWESLMRVFKK